MVETIMIIDDSRETIQMLKKLFESEGFNVITALNGVEAIKTLKTINSKDLPDLLLLDMFMPKMSGRTFLEKIRQDKNPKLREIKTAFLTVAAFQDYGREILKKLNVLDYIIKQFVVDDKRTYFEISIGHSPTEGG